LVSPAFLFWRGPFPYVEAAAIPSIAVPLLQDDCINTTVDIDWVWEYIHLTSDDKTRRLDLNSLHDEVKSWFTPGGHRSSHGSSGREFQEEIAREWLARDGKRLASVPDCRDLRGSSRRPRGTDP
jgi:hypothetical protein